MQTRDMLSLAVDWLEINEMHSLMFIAFSCYETMTGFIQMKIIGFSMNSIDQCRMLCCLT